MPQPNSKCLEDCFQDSDTMMDAERESAAAAACDDAHAAEDVTQAKEAGWEAQALSRQECAKVSYVPPHPYKINVWNGRKLSKSANVFNPAAVQKTKTLLAELTERWQRGVPLPSREGVQRAVDCINQECTPSGLTNRWYMTLRAVASSVI
jgi:hypothetical protein